MKVRLCMTTIVYRVGVIIIDVCFWDFFNYNIEMKIESLWIRLIEG